MVDAAHDSQETRQRPRLEPGAGRLRMMG